MITYGFEKEYFVLDNNDNPVLAPIALPHDECGYLVEARGDHHVNPFKAAHLFLAEEERLARVAQNMQVKLDTTQPTRRLNPKLAREALRRFGKNPLTPDRGSLYGRDYKATDRLARAGLHVHFGSVVEYQDRDGHQRSITTLIDIPRYIQLLDKAFADEIKSAQRLPGLYEIKQHGFEYRSLPASADPMAVAVILSA